MTRKGNPGKRRPIEQAEAITKKTAEAMGFEHLETAFEKEPAGVYLRIYLDRDGGISLTDCENYHRAVQPLLEHIDYDFLEVCSAGIDRPIKNEREAQKTMGHEVEIKLFKPLDGSKTYTGTFLKLEDDVYHISTPAGNRAFHKKDVALACRTVDLSVLDEAAGEYEEETR